MIKPIGLDELIVEAPIAGPLAAQTVAGLTDDVKRRLVWFMHWRSHQPGGLRLLAHEILSRCFRTHLGSKTMHTVGFNPETKFQGEIYETICEELGHYPLESLNSLERQLADTANIGNWFWDDPIVDPEVEKRNKLRQEQERHRITSLMKAENRKTSAARFLIVCRERAKSLPNTLAELCRDRDADWELSYFRDLTAAILTALECQISQAKQQFAETKICGGVRDAIDFAHCTKSLVIVSGRERLGKSKAAECWQLQNPDKARLISLTAVSTETLFYSEIHQALGCGPEEKDANDRRLAIRATLQNRDITVLIDEAHCLFGLSEKAQIKRLEYIRTELVNRGVPVVLLVTPQFHSRLADLETKSRFNVDQLRGRVAKWVQLPDKPSRHDIESLCKFLLPDAPDTVRRHLANLGAQSEYPFAAVRNAIQEAAHMKRRGDLASVGEEDLIKRAVGAALFTDSMLAKSHAHAAPPNRGRKPRREPPVQPIADAALPEAGNTVARHVPPPCTPDNSPVPSTVHDRNQSPVLVD